MKFIRTALLASGLALVAAAHAQEGALAKVNGVTIPQSRADLLMKDMAAQGRPDTPEMRNAVRQELINREIVAQEAVKRGRHKQPNVAARIQLYRQSALVNAYFEDYLKANPVTDEMLRKEYDRIRPRRELGRLERVDGSGRVGAVGQENQDAPILFDARVLEVGPQEVGRPCLVSGRVDRIDAEELLEDLDGLVPKG